MADTIICGWCNERPATCEAAFDRAPARDGARWPKYGCDECCGHCRCGGRACCCVFIQAAAYGTEDKCVVALRATKACAAMARAMAAEHDEESRRWRGQPVVTASASAARDALLALVGRLEAGE